MKKFSVSLVFIKQNAGSTIDISLRVMLTTAVSKEEALGKAVLTFKKEMLGYQLSLSESIEIEI